MEKTGNKSPKENTPLALLNENVKYLTNLLRR